MKIIKGILLLQLLLAATCAWGFAGGDGSVDNPWQITSRSELEAVNNDLSAHYILMNDIDLGGTNYTDAVIAQTDRGTNPLFTGVFDGNFKTIHNLTITGGASSGALGLFGRVEYDGVVKRLKLENCNITGSGEIGMLVGSMWERALVSDCVASGNVSGGDYVGGLIGGCVHSSIMRSGAEGSVAGADYVGGLVGGMWGEVYPVVKNGMVANCYSMCSVSGNDNVGGLIGEHYEGAVVNCYANGVVDGTSKVNGLIGRDDYGSAVSCCFWNREISGQTKGSEYFYGGEGITSAEMSQQSTFTSEGWTFSEPENAFTGAWYMPEDGFPILYRGSEGMRMVPEITHLDLQGVISVLESAGFEIGTTNYVHSMTVTNGAVAGISATEGGLYLTNGLPVDIYVSLGPGGDGSESAPFPVACETDLQMINNNLAAHYVLMRDIYLTNDYTTAVIANQGSYFTGGFDGNDKKIVGLHIENAASDHLGLFGRVGAGGSIRDLTLNDVKIQVESDNDADLRSYVGSMAGETAGNSRIENCHGTGFVNGYRYIGGIGGVNDGDLKRSSFNGIVVGYGCCGGVVGLSYENSRVERSCFKGVAVCPEDGEGGFVGWNYGIIEYCYAVGGICDGNSHSGGFVGDNLGGVIRDCYSRSLIYSIHGAGFVAYNDNGIIERCYASGAQRWITWDRPQGFIAYGFSDSISGCFFDKDVLGYANYDSDVALGTNTLAMQTQSTYTDAGWKFYENASGRVDGWYMPENDYPVLFWQSEYLLVCPELEGLTLIEMQSALVDAGFTLGSVIYTNSLTVTSGAVIGASVFSGCSYITNVPPVDIFVSTGIGGDGSESAPYPIACEADLQAVNNDLSAHYYLVRNIDLLEQYSEAAIDSFTGSLDGRNNVLDGLDVEDTHGAGLFSELSGGAVVKNISIQNADIKSGSNDGDGILAAYCEGSVLISNCYVQGQVQGGACVGGLVGSCWSTSTSEFLISHCRASVNIEGGACVGGLVGEIYRGKIIFSSASGHVVGGQRIGGLVGACQYTRFEDSFAKCVVKGTGGQIGGLVGEFREGTAERCFASGSVTGGDCIVGGFSGCIYEESYINKCFSLGYVSGIDHVGGFCGDFYSSVVSNAYSLCAVNGGARVGGFSGAFEESTVWNCYSAGSVEGNDIGGFFASLYSSTVTSCFWDVEVSGVTDSEGGIGTNTVAMQDEATFIDAGWDFTNIWYMAGYPKLRSHVDSSEDRFQLWVFDTGVAAGERSQTADPAGDKIPNLLKYAMGFDPLTYCTSSDLMSPVMDETEGRFIISYQKSKDADGVSLYPSWSGSLSSAEWRQDGLAPRKISEDSSSELWEASITIQGNPSAFIRLNAELIEE